MEMEKMKQELEKSGAILPRLLIRKHEQVQ